MTLSPNFSLAEFAVSGSYPSLVQPVPAEYLPNVRALATTILQPLRDFVGASIRITSGYRSQQLNAAVGGSETSQHRRASAADIVPPDVRALFVAILTGQVEVPCGQVIYYPDQGFLHVALPSTHYSTPAYFASRAAKKYERIRTLDDLTRLGL